MTVHFASLSEQAIVPLRFFMACSLLGLAAWSLGSLILDTVARAKKMHQIPCTKCLFFTGDYRLKCTVNPHIANTEAAIYCSDYRKQQVVLSEYR